MLCFRDYLAGFRPARAADILCVGVGDVALSTECDDDHDMEMSSLVSI